MHWRRASITALSDCFLAKIVHEVLHTGTGTETSWLGSLLRRLLAVPKNLFLSFHIAKLKLVHS